jgi:hypothetical protein
VKLGESELLITDYPDSSDYPDSFLAQIKAPIGPVEWSFALRMGAIRVIRAVIRVIRDQAVEPRRTLA